MLARSPSFLTSFSLSPSNARQVGRTMEEASPYRVDQGGGDRGRIAVATRPLVPGEIVLAEVAVACVAAAGRSLCDDCLEPTAAGEGAQCVACRTGSGLGGQGRGSATPSVRLSAKLLGRCSGSLGQKQSSRVKILLTHERQQSSGNGRQDQEEQVAQVVRLAAAGSGNNLARTTEESLCLLSERLGGLGVHDVLRHASHELARVSVNAITTCDGSGATGLGLFPSAAMFNHSCVPNVQAWWKGAKLELRCTKHVAVGEELCFSYIQVDQPSTLRRAQLRHSWFFTCHCRRCASGQWDAELSGLRCPSAICPGAVPPPWRGPMALCNRCGTGLAEFLQGLTRDESRGGSDNSTPRAPPKSGVGTGEGQASLEERLLGAQRSFDTGVEAYMCEDPETALVALEESLAVREGLLHSFSKDLLRTLRYASYAAVATRRWAKARSFLLRWLHPMDSMFGAAEVWDIAAMRVDAGLVTSELGNNNTSDNATPFVSAPQYPAGDMHSAAAAHLEEGLRWIWICLGKDSGLPAETAALDASAKYGITVQWR